MRRLYFHPSWTESSDVTYQLLYLYLRVLEKVVFRKILCVEMRQLSWTFLNSEISFIFSFQLFFQTFYSNTIICTELQMSTISRGLTILVNIGNAGFRQMTATYELVVDEAGTSTGRAILFLQTAVIWSSTRSGKQDSRLSQQGMKMSMSSR